MRAASLKVSHNAMPNTSGAAEERFAFEHGTRSTAERFAAYGRGIAEVRAALEWAFLPGADATIDAALTPA